MAGSGADRWYGSRDRWPRHDKQWFRDALGKARRQGWLYKVLTNHGVGVVYCQDPRQDPDDEPCTFAVYSTGRAGESAARELVRLVDRCPHMPPADRPPLAQAEHHLDSAERLLEAAEALIEKLRHEDAATEAWAMATELLDQVEASTDEVEGLMSRAAREDREAQAAAGDADDLLRSLDHVAETPASAVEAAEYEVHQAQATLKDLPQRSTVRALGRRVLAVRAKLNDLKVRMTGS